MKRFFILLLTIVMLLQCACAAVPQNLISNEDIVLTAAANSADTIYANEYAYVRGGEWKEKNWHDILNERKLGEMLVVKNGTKVGSSTRYMYLRFDISGLSLANLTKAELAVKFTKIQADTDVPFMIYLVSNDWKESDVTFATQPAKINSAPVASSVILNRENADVTSAIREMIQKGEKYVTLMILQSMETISETQIEFSKIKDSEMPRLIISGSGTSAIKPNPSTGVTLPESSEGTRTLYTYEHAYVRGGADWKDKNWHDILAERKFEDMLIVKNGHISSSTTRHIYLKFDISGLTIADVGKAELSVKFTKIEADTDVPFMIYLVSNDWSEGQITYATQPKKLNGTPIASSVILNTESADVTSAIREMIQNGEKYVTLMVLQSIETLSETQIAFSKLEEGEMPHLTISGSYTQADTPDADNAGTEPPKTEENELMQSFVTTEYAYVRGGTWKEMNWHEINAENNTNNVICIKNSLGTGSPSRRALFRFDLSGLSVLDVGFAELFITFASIQKEPVVHFDIYLVDNNWSESTVTWKTQPQKLSETPIASNVVFGSLAKVDVTEFVKDMLFDEKTSFTLMLVQTDETEGVTKIYTSSADSSLPCFKVYKEAPSSDISYQKQIVSDEAENKAIWDYAKKMYDEWYARYLKVKEKPLGTPTLIESDASHFDKTVMSPGSNPSGTFTERATRTVDSISDLSKYVDITKETKVDRYGGIMDNSLRQEATGYFYTTKIGDRWWVIDPLGYPCVLRSMSGVTTAYRQSPTQKAAFLEKFGTNERWAISTTRHLIDDLAFNCTSTSDNSIYEIVDGLTYFKRFSAMIDYANLMGFNATEGGQAKFSENNTMPVFDPLFETFVDERAKSNAAPDDRNVIAYITDNELPMDLTMLRDYLTIDPYKEINRYSYACAWYWVTQMTGKENISDSDLTADLMDLFRGFIWDRYYYVVDTAIEKYDPNHLYAGTKYLNWSKESPWVLRFTAEYVDILTINWYGAWEPQAEFIYDFARYANAPFMVTEFYAKSSDTFDNLTSKDGAGFYVKTQADRGLFYQNYTLRLLEAKNCVGWQWFQYTDNDPLANTTDTTSRDSNKGIVNNRHEEYTELTDDMIEINKNVYKLIEYFDAK